MSETPILPDDETFAPPTMQTMRGRTSPREERLRTGDVVLGRYTVLSELGEGGMGVVYRCLDSVGGIEVALKCLPPELSRDESEMEGVRENYAIVAKLHHSAISGLRQLEKDPDFGEYYLVMDLAEGEDLSQILRHRHGTPMPLADALAILSPLAAALDYAHGEKVLHRDVKPANVKIAYPVSGGAPRVQLLDFGLAAEVRSSLSRVSRKGHLGSSGTPAYMAPEQWEARPQRPATDQYALAVMAYEMLAGVRPFGADDPDVLRRAVLGREPDPVPGLSRGENAALLRALSKDPDARFPSCTAFVEALRLAGTVRPTRSRLAMATAALVAVVSGALWFARSCGGAEDSGGPPSPAAAVDSHAEPGGASPPREPQPEIPTVATLPSAPPDQVSDKPRFPGPGSAGTAGESLAKSAGNVPPSRPSGAPTSNEADALAVTVVDRLTNDVVFAQWKKRIGTEIGPLLLEIAPLKFRPGGASAGAERSDSRMTRTVFDALVEELRKTSVFRVRNAFDEDFGADATKRADPDCRAYGELSLETTDAGPAFRLRVSFDDPKEPGETVWATTVELPRDGTHDTMP